VFLDVDEREKIVPHEGMVALGMVLGEADVFIHIESYHVFKGQTAFAVHGDQLSIGSQRGRTGGETQYIRTIGCRGEIADGTRDVGGGPAGKVMVIWLDDQSHGYSPIE